VTTSLLKAYAVTEPYENKGGIYFAKSNLDARKWGANIWNDNELGGMRVVRAPWADGYSVVPASLMVDHGWHFECHGCGELIDEDWLHDNNKNSRDVLGSQWGNVFCDQNCKAFYEEQEKQRKEVECNYLAVLREIVTTRFGMVKFTERNHAYATKCKGVWILQQAEVYFEFPGMKVGPASLRADCNNMRHSGPQPLQLWVPSGDNEVFQKFVEKMKGRRR